MMGLTEAMYGGEALGGGDIKEKERKREREREKDGDEGGWLGLGFR